MISVLAFTHIASGSFAILFGTLAAITRKGGKIHIPAGRAFVILMTLSSLLGAGLGLIYFDRFFITFFAGLLAIYLVLSGWISAASDPQSTARLDLGLLNGANFTALVALGVVALTRPDGQIFGFAGEDYLLLGVMAAIGLICDISLIRRKTLSDKHRIARHLWRMLLGFFIAAGSAFTGPGATAFPQALQDSGFLALPELLILLLMVFYLVRVLFFPIRD